MNHLIAYSVSFGTSVVIVIGVTLMVFAAELAYPQGTQLSAQARRCAALFILISIIAAVTASTVFGLLPEQEPLFETTGLFGTTIGALVIAVAFDFCLYWLHRAQHVFPFLWRFHAVHHSIEQMGVPSGYHHVSEPFLRAAFCSLPVSLIARPAELGIVAAITTLHGFYVHSATRLGFGRYSAVVADNRYHRIHHSVDPRHHNQNFAVILPLWDWLFGTFHFPAHGEWPVVGLHDRREPKTIRDYILASENSDRPRRDIPAAAVIDPDRVNV